MGNESLTAEKQVREWLSDYVAMMEFNLGVLSTSKVEGLYQGCVDRILDVRAYLRAAPETPAPQAPIALLTINMASEPAGVTLYAPGLPPGDHDLYCEPEKVAPYMRAPETKAKPLTLGKLILDTARGDVKQRTLSPEEAQQVWGSIRRYFKGPLQFIEPENDGDWPRIVDAEGFPVANLFWPCHPADENEAAEQATYSLGHAMAAVGSAVKAGG
jgi:hypothetical protein